MSLGKTGHDPDYSYQQSSERNPVKNQEDFVSLVERGQESQSAARIPVWGLLLNGGWGGGQRPSLRPSQQ